MSSNMANQIWGPPTWLTLNRAAHCLLIFYNRAAHCLLIFRMLRLFLSLHCGHVILLVLRHNEPPGMNQLTIINGDCRFSRHFSKRQGWIENVPTIFQLWRGWKTIGRLHFIKRHALCHHQRWGARWLSGRVSDSGARGPGFETYRRRVVSLSKTLYSPKVLVTYPGSDGSVPIWLKNCWPGR